MISGISLQWPSSESPHVDPLEIIGEYAGMLTYLPVNLFSKLGNDHKFLKLSLYGHGIHRLKGSLDSLNR